MLIYCDSVILIYLMDHTGPFQARAASRIAALRAAGDQIVASDLVRLECRVRPIRRGDTAVLAAFDGFFGRPDVQILPLTTAIYDRATIIRATHNFNTTDSMHLAAAAESGCHRFLTNDTRLSRFPDLPVEILP
jgi:predicted nucleic acid-binding protein